MMKCFAVALCVCSLITFICCAPEYENIREKRSTRQDVTDQFKSVGASRTRRQSSDTVDIVYIDASSIDTTKLQNLQSKKSSRLAPVNDETKIRQIFQQQPETNTEFVIQNQDYIIYKLKDTGDSSANSVSDEKTTIALSGSYSYGSEQFGYSDVKHPPPSPPDDGNPPPPPPQDWDPPPRPPHDGDPPPPPPHDGDPLLPSPYHVKDPPRPPHLHPAPPPPPYYYPPSPYHNHPPPPPPPGHYRSNYYDRYQSSHYDNYYRRRPPPPPPPDEHRSRKFYDDRQIRQSPYDRPPPPGRDWPPQQYGRPPGPPRHEGPPPRRGGPPDRYDRGPPDRYDRVPPGRFDRRPPNRYDRGPPDRGPPDHFDRRPPSPPNREQHKDQGNENNKYTQYDNNPAYTSSTTESGTQDKQYDIDIRFNDDDRNQQTTEAIYSQNPKRDITTARPLSPFLFQATPVTPED